MHWAYKGHENEGRAALAPILDLDIEATSIAVVPWNKLIGSAFGGVIDSICRDNITRDLYSWNMKNYSASTYTTSFSKMDDYFAKHPGGRSSVLQFEFFPNQAMAAVPADETAFPWRDTTGYMLELPLLFTIFKHSSPIFHFYLPSHRNFNMLFDGGDNATEAASIALGLELRDDLVATSGYPELTVFINYAHGDEKIEQIYGREKLPRLASLKNIWDPNHFFSYNNGLPNQYP